MKSLNSLFYKDLPVHNMSVEDLLVSDDHFTAVPENWHVVIVTVQNSAEAIKDGLHQQVNLAATGSIISVSNLVKSIDKNITIPYFFGGDGATFIVPDAVIKQVMETLSHYKIHTLQNMQLSLNLGSLPVSYLKQNCSILKIAKLKLNANLILPVILGSGLKQAETIINKGFIQQPIIVRDKVHINLDGMECRWKKVAAPKKGDKIICLLLNAEADEQQRDLYRQVFLKIDEIFGNYQDRQPISIHKLQLDLSARKMLEEMKAKKRKSTATYFIKNWVLSAIGKYYFVLFKQGREYVRLVKDQSYTLMMDGLINCVISGNDKKIKMFTSWLDVHEAMGLCKYGIHVASASILSCYVEDRKDRHIHFVDGADGGLTKAGKMIKEKYDTDKTEIKDSYTESSEVPQMNF